MEEIEASGLFFGGALRLFLSFLPSFSSCGAPAESLAGVSWGEKMNFEGSRPRQSPRITLERAHLLRYLFLLLLRRRRISWK